MAELTGESGTPVSSAVVNPSTFRNPVFVKVTVGPTTIRELIVGVVPSVVYRTAVEPPVVTVTSTVFANVPLAVPIAGAAFA